VPLQPQKENHRVEKSKVYGEFCSISSTSPASLQFSIHLSLVALRLQRQERSIFPEELCSALTKKKKKITFYPAHGLYESQILRKVTYIKTHGKTQRNILPNAV